MVLKKPYAFLIKRFKLIHFALTILAVYIITKTSAIHSFFVNYIKNQYSAIITVNFKSNFINPILYISVLSVLVILFFMILLLRSKKKKEKIYSFYFTYYVILIIGYLYIGTVFTGLEKEVLEPEFAKLLKDITLLGYLPQIGFIVVTTIRALGFNVKQFNFKADIKELEITSSDDEEIEFSVSFDTYKTERNLRRFVREFRYYILENKFVVIVLLSVFSLVSINYVVKNRNQIRSASFKMNQAVAFNNLETKILDAVITDVDLKGNKIKKNKYYVLLKMSIKNNTKKDLTVDVNKYSLFNNTKKKSILPSVGYSNLFKDYGVPFNLPLIRRNSEYIVVLPYEIDKDNLRDKYQFRFYQNVVIKNNVAYPVYNILRLKPIILDKVQTVSEHSLNDEIRFNNTNLGNSYIKIEKYAIDKSYTYEYEKCVNEKCKKYYDNITPGVFGHDSSKTILGLNTEFSFDESTEYFKTTKNLSSFANDTFKIEYFINDVKHISDVEAVHSKYDPNLAALKVAGNIQEASKINLLITIRNKQYIIELKN